MLLGALVLAAGIFFLLLSLPRRAPPLFLVEEAIVPPEATAQSVELVTFESGANGRELERPFALTLELPSEVTSRYDMILAALRETLRGSLWPDELPVPVIYVLEDREPQPLVLDFKVTAPPALTVSDERLLLAAIRETLLRNGAERVQILVNHSEAASFLGHVAPN